MGYVSGWLNGPIQGWVGAERGGDFGHQGTQDTGLCIGV
jgi:hypothetical protein